ncbi:MAG: hypothetical protein U0P81_12990 [Holophagaceae bacterium]
MHPLVERFLQNQLPEPMVAALLGGGLPVPPLDLVQAQAHAWLTDSPHKEKALDGFLSLPESVVDGILEHEIAPPGPLGLVLRYRTEHALLERALLHRDLTAEVLEPCIASLPGDLLEIPLNNQVLWMQRPRILDELELHPGASYNLKRKVNEFRFDVLKIGNEEVVKERLDILDEVESGRLDAAWAELPMPEASAEDESEEVLRERYAKPLQDFDGQDISLTLTQRVMRLRTNQKIMLAQKGGKEERTILIREANRLIQVGVIRNARITDGEVAYIAQMRSINEEVLRIITLNREWMKKYAIVKALVLNARTPLPLAMQHYRRLHESDLKLMQRDKNIAEMLRREAKKWLETMGQKK